MVLSLRRLTLVLLATTIAAVSFLTIALVSPNQPEAQAAPIPAGTPLLLVHGYGDTCQKAFESVNMNAQGQPNNTGPNATEAIDYFRKHGWGTIDEVGYYNNDYCNSNAQDYHTSCQNLASENVRGTTNDPIKHVACLMAWYIYKHYTAQNQWVSILAHSMGGLVVRAAIGFSGNGAGTKHDSNFPPALKVRRVVTVGTPHGGIEDFYAGVIKAFDNSGEVQDMVAGSGFMNEISAIQKPQGEGGTYWALLSAGVGCNMMDRLGETAFSCQAIGHEKYPLTDTLIQSSSALAMQADYKVLYGCADSNDTGLICADYTTMYRHTFECDGITIWFIHIGGCPNPPFFLNDGTENPASTRAWICWQNCTNTSRDAFDFDLNKTYTALHSLAEMNNLLAPYTQLTSSALNTDGRMESFWCDNNGDIWHAWQGSYGGGWSSDKLQGGGPFYCKKGGVAVGENADGRLEVFALSNDNRLWHVWNSPDTVWSSWSAMPYSAYSAPAVGRNADGRLEVFVLGPGQRIMHIWQTEPNGGWSNWGYLGPDTPLFSSNSAPTVISNADGHLEVFGVIDGGGHVYHIFQSKTSPGGWGANWGDIESQPSNAHPMSSYARVVANRNADGRLELYVNGYLNHYWHIWQSNDPGGWIPNWVDDSGGMSFLNDPGLCTNSDGRLEAFGTGTDYALYHAWQGNPNGLWTGYSKVGTPPPTTFVLPVSCLRNSINNPEILVEDVDGHLWHTYADVTGGWDHWSRF